MSPLLPAAMMIAAGLRGTVDLSKKTELRAGNSNTSGPMLDIETTPSARIVLRPSAWEFQAAYLPRFCWHPLLTGAPDIWQQGTLGVSWHNRRVAISLYEEASYGHLSFGSLVASPDLGAPRLGTLLPSTNLSEVLYSRTGVFATIAGTRRLTHTLRLDATVSGGIGSASRAVLPLQTAGRFEFGTTYAASRLTDLAFTLSASRALFSTGQDNSILEAGMSWRHAFGRYAAATAGVGAAWAAGGGGSAAYPTAAATFTYRLPGRPRDRLTAQLDARLFPAIDARRGVVDPRVESSGEVTWNVTSKVSLRGRAGLVRSVSPGGPAAVSLGLGEGALMIRVNDRLQFDGGVRSAMGSMAQGVAPTSQWVGFVGATITAPSIHF